MLDYSLCDETVTLYRKTEEGIHRRVLDGVRFIRQIAAPTESYGKSKEKKFLLIIPGDFPLQPGDRIYAGIGPKEADWNTFLPVSVPELFEVSFAKPCFWEGKIVHWEAGHKKEAV